MMLSVPTLLLSVIFLALTGYLSAVVIFPEKF